MKLNNIWGYGQLFGFSGIEGENRYYNDFIGTLTKREIEIRFEFKEWVKLYFPLNNSKFKAIMSDFIESTNDKGDFFITFIDNDSLVGYSPVKPEFSSSATLNHMTTWGVDVYYTDTDSFGVVLKEENGLYKFSIHHSFSYSEARAGANRYISVNIQELKRKRYDYYQNLPKCSDPKYEMLYYKALSINKVNVHTPEGKIKYMWTTPDRVPHRHMWLWDSVFHALAIVNYNPNLAKDSLYAVLSLQREDGFIAHMANPTDISDVTQPQVLSWGVYELYKKTGDIEYLKKCVDHLERYLKWDIENRDKNNNGLLEWLTEPDYTECKCGESGLDNSPRFDFDYDMDAIDFSTFSARDAYYLSLIYKELKNEAKAKEWNDYFHSMKDKINELMWSEEDGCYYDRLFTGELTKVITPTSFLPMFANISTKAQAKKMVKTLLNEDLLWTINPVSTIAKNHPTYSNDMWRGGTWLNLNYFIIKGLLNYGYDDLAESLRIKTLEMVDKWYQKSGCIFEFYDSADKVEPFKCDRKGTQGEEPDWRVHVHSIADYNWSACFTLLFIEKNLY